MNTIKGREKSIFASKQLIKRNQRSKRTIMIVQKNKSAHLQIFGNGAYDSPSAIKFSAIE